MRIPTFGLLLIFWAAPWVTAQNDFNVPNSPVELTFRVQELFAKSCAECHDENSGKRVRGGFGHVMDLQRQLDEKDYLIAGDPDGSEHLHLMTTDEADMRMPPPDSDVYKPTQEDIAVFRAWIVAMADAPLPNKEVVDAFRASLAVDPAQQVSGLDAPKKKISTQTLFARTHPLVVHFPIALLIVGAFVELLGWLLRKEAAWASTVRWCVGIAALSGPVAVAAGWILARIEGYADATVFAHRWLGVATAILAIVSYIALIAASRTHAKTLIWLARILLIASAIVVSFAGHTGGELVYGVGYPFN